MENITILEYFKKNNDYLTIELTDKYYIWLDNATGEICSELCDYKRYDSVNVNYLFNYDFRNIKINDVKTIVLNKIIEDYIDRWGK